MTRDQLQHRARPSTATSIRVALSLGILLGLGGAGTMALWSSTAVVKPGTITAAQLDITVNGQLAGISNQAGTHNDASWSMTEMLPGEKRAMSITVANPATSIPADLRLSAYATGTLGPALRVTVFAGGTPTNTGGSLTAPAASTYRSASCTGGTQIGAANVAVGTTPASATIVDASKRHLDTGATFTYCILITVDNTTPTWSNVSLSDATSTVAFTVQAAQEGAP